MRGGHSGTATEPSKLGRARFDPPRRIGPGGDELGDGGTAPSADLGAAGREGLIQRRDSGTGDREVSPMYAETVLELKIASAFIGAAEVDRAGPG